MFHNLYFPSGTHHSIPFDVLPQCLSTCPLTYRAQHGGAVGHVKALKMDLIPLYIDFQRDQSTCLAYYTITNSPRCSLDMDKCPLLIIPPEEESISLFFDLLNTQRDSEVHHQIVKEVYVPSWISQDHPIPSQATLGSGILSFICS